MEYGDFYTFSEYMKKQGKVLTASMEDYLEMIYRLSLNTGYTRIHDLSYTLNVQPPSATKMVQRLGELKLLKYEKYGIIILEEEGKILGKALLKKHMIIEDFLRVLGISESGVLEETEKVEHTLSDETVKCFEDYVQFVKNNPDIIVKFKNYREK